jgi:rhodanese-related sulfurtransferase
MPISRGINQLVEEAMAAVSTLPVLEAIALLHDPTVQFVDLREAGELDRDGVIPGAYHAPRGMLEFWIDPKSPYFRKVFASEKPLVLFCAGGLRSALAAKTLVDMGLVDVAHIEGGFAAWKDAGGPIEARPPRPPNN